MNHKASDINDFLTVSAEIPRWSNLARDLEALGFLRKPERTYLGSLIDSGKELEICGRNKAADRVFSKVQGALQIHASASKRREKKHSFRLEEVAKKLRQTEYQDLIEFFNRHKRLFPPGERDYFKEKLDDLKEEPGRYEKRRKSKGAYAMTGFLQKRVASTTKQVRGQLYDSVYRYQIALAGRSIISGAPEALPDETGFYNTLYNLNDVMEYIGKIDPLWIEDFKTHYRDLQRLQAMFS